MTTVTRAAQSGVRCNGATEAPSASARPGRVVDGGLWRGPDLETWRARLELGVSQMHAGALPTVRRA